MSTAPAQEESSVWQSAVFGFLVCLLGAIMAKPLFFITSDLGRHIVNGKVTLTQWVIPNTNLYSYTEPDFPFVNHHWASGVIFYLVHMASGFTGLSLLVIGLSILTFYLLFEMAYLKGRFDVAMLLSLLVIPLIGTRTEVRPEIFSYLLIAVFFRLLWLRREARLPNKMLWMFPLLMVAWVNLHIYFFFGCVMVAGMALDEILADWDKPDRWVRYRAPLLVLAGTSLATLLNPSGIWGALEPLLIFGNYKYAVSENQPIFVMEDMMRDGVPVYFKLAVAVMCIAVFRALAGWYWGKTRPWLGLLLPGILATVLALGAIRHLALFAYVSIPVVTILLSDLPVKNLLHNKRLATLSFAGFAALLISFGWMYWRALPHLMGIGLQPDVMKSVEFFKEQKLQGPIFNDYDIGGYLIYGLYPDVKVFTDNRPEAYPGSFFQDVYLPIQNDEKLWYEASDKYGFKTIFVHARNQLDITKAFMNRRLNDSMWVPVFNDDRAFILVKNIPENADVIRRFSLRKN